MAESLSVNPNDLRAAAAKLADVSSQMKQVLSSVNAQLAALGSPWGNDSTGDQFANGSSGYLAQVDQVNSTINAGTKALDSVSQSLTTSANSFEHADQQPGVLSSAPIQRPHQVPGVSAGPASGRK
jgi:WXG100 family type VII secretion target